MLKVDLKQQAREVCPGGGSRYKLEIFPVFSLLLPAVQCLQFVLPDLAAVYLLTWKSGT